jgi:hypothetical protein
MKKLIASLKVYASVVTSLAKKVFKKEANQEATLFI